MHIDSFTDLPAVRLVTPDGEAFLFDFSERFGPLMIEKGRNVDWVPPRRSAFWRALDAWVSQGCRLDSDGRCLYDVPRPIRFVTLVGRHCVEVPDGREPADVRAEWFERMKLPAPDDAVRVLTKDHP
jgi:hypothetical protein